MQRATRREEPHAGGDIIDFEQALLDACPAAELNELMTEAEMLADAFAPSRRPAHVAALARSLDAGLRHLDHGRARARRLAAALRRLAKG